MVKSRMGGTTAILVVWVAVQSLAVAIQNSATHISGQLAVITSAMARPRLLTIATLASSVGALAVACVAVWRLVQESLARWPDVFFKDVLLRRQTGGHYTVETKGIANLGTYAMVIHSVNLVDSGKPEHRFASGYPMVTVTRHDAFPSSAERVTDKEWHVLSHLHLLTDRQLRGASEDPRPVRAVKPEDVGRETGALIIVFRYGGYRNDLFEQRLDYWRPSDDPTTLHFAGVTPNRPVRMRSKRRTLEKRFPDQGTGN